MKKYYFLIIVALILGLVLTGCSLLSNISQVPTTEQSGITYLTKALPLASLVGLWSFDEGDGVTTVVDSSGYGNDGTVNGATTGVLGKFGNALSFDGVNDYVDCGAAVDDSITTGITLEAWIKPAFRQNGGIISNDITYSSKKGYDFFLWSAGGSYGRLYIDFGNGSSTLGRTWWDIPSLEWYNQWHHVAATWDGSEIILYADGSEVADVEYSGPYFDPEKNTFIGAINYSTPAYYYFNRLIDEVRIWNTALTSDTIEDHYSESIYDFNGLLSPYAEPPRAFKTGSSIPLKWQYTDAAGNVMDSSAADPEFQIVRVSGDLPVAGDPIVVDYPGNSGLRYDIDTDMWIFNWQTKDWTAGVYNISITSVQTGQANGPFPIQLK